jgi:hypothetical protein
VDGLQALAGLASLKTLTLRLDGCDQLANLDGLRGLPRRRGFEILLPDHLPDPRRSKCCAIQ